jgi:methionyl-tRNA formyltransferase
MTTRIVFMGSPEFALPILRCLHENFNMVGVVTQPDRESGRGRRLAPPPVKTLALEFGLPVIQPAQLKDPEAQAQLAAWAPDVIVVAAYGQILRRNVLDLPPAGCLNVHASLLPRWQGAPGSAGDPARGRAHRRHHHAHGSGLDTGPILSQAAILIDEKDTYGFLSEAGRSGRSLLMEPYRVTCPAGTRCVCRENSDATYAPLLKKRTACWTGRVRQQCLPGGSGIQSWPRGPIANRAGEA